MICLSVTQIQEYSVEVCTKTIEIAKVEDAENYAFPCIFKTKVENWAYTIIHCYCFHDDLAKGKF